MKTTFRELILASAAVLALALPAQANNINVCSPDAAGQGTGARQVGGTLSAVPSGAIYTLNGQGCARVTLQDYGYFLSQGYTQGSGQFTTILTPGVATGTTDYAMPMPAKTYIQQIIFSNSVASAVTGGISVGTAANGTQVVTAQAVGASTDVAVAQSNISLPVPVTTGLAYTLHFAAVTAWNSTNVTITVIAGYY
jgi:hypothetical protein